jgi:hypothetical protein
MSKLEPQSQATPPAAATGAAALLTNPIHVINVGLEGFATELAAEGVAVTHVQWSPPAGGDAKLAALLGKLGM